MTIYTFHKKQKESHSSVCSCVKTRMWECYFFSLITIRTWLLFCLKYSIHIVFKPIISSTGYFYKRKKLINSVNRWHDLDILKCVSMVFVPRHVNYRQKYSKTQASCDCCVQEWGIQYVRGETGVNRSLRAEFKRWGHTQDPHTYRKQHLRPFPTHFL